MAMAEVGWAISMLGWIVSPVATRLIADGFALLGFDESEKMRDLEARLLPQLALMLEWAQRAPPNQRGHVELWARRLRAAFYDAEDILDVADYYRLQKQVFSQSGNSSAIDRAKHIFSGRTHKLKKALKKLEKLIEQGSRFMAPMASTNSSSRNLNGATNSGRNMSESVTTSSLRSQIVFGRDKDCETIRKLLRESSSDSEPSSSRSKCYTVIAIYGIAGSGKTTLAQYVCTYEKMEDNYFSPIMWIHVSQSCTVRDIHQKMLEAAGGSSHEFRNLSTLQERLEEQLIGKRFLLVLDNICPGTVSNVHDQDQLLSPLMVGKKGSMVLITTRFQDVAMSLGSQSTMKIPDLCENDFFNLFMHYALDGKFDAKELETFIVIGKQIAEKLKSSPLAARIVGARLCKKIEPAFWRSIGDEDILHDTMGALWWSYQQLDEQVRRCFAYCSMFPQGYTFTRDESVDLWIAEGFIKTTSLSMQEECFDELVSCFFLQPEYVYGSNNIRFKIHDLTRELAIRVAGNDCFQIEGGEISEIPRDVRHLFVRSKTKVKFAEQICKLRKLRTLIYVTNIGGLGITIKELESILKNLKKLRVIQVDVEGYMEAIPSGICKLKHLRFVRIHNPLSLRVHLPKNLSSIYHLQILELRGSGVLEFSNVKNMGHLINLRGIRYSGFSFINSDISGFPGLGKLKSLRELSDFRVKKEKGYELHQLKDINHLSGTLRISGLEYVESKEVALEAKLIDKKNLTALSVEWSQPSPRQHCLTPDQYMGILEGLCPPSQLTELKICHYGGQKFPSWQSQIGNLQCLELFHCYNLEALPEIGKLFVHLDRLKLTGLPKIQKLPKLPESLKSLDIQWCEALVVTCREDVDSIRSLFVKKASQYETSLNTTVHAEEIDKFANEQPDKFSTIMSNIFGRCGSLPARLIRSGIKEEENFRFVLTKSVDRVVISNCVITDTVLHNSLRGSTSLVSLNLRGLPFFTAIPSEVMMSFPELYDLSIEDCVNFSLLQGLNGLKKLQHLSITKCPNLAAPVEKARVLHGIAVDDIPLVPQLVSTEGCSSLWSLRIHESEELRDEETLQQFRSLASLDISFCNWNRLPENLVTLTSLEHLHLEYCRNIRALPALPASLRSFELTDCDPAFMKSCQKAGDPNWHRIAHVPTKRFYP